MADSKSLQRRASANGLFVRLPQLLGVGSLPLYKLLIFNRLR
jgi:hypothetical protein